MYSLDSSGDMCGCIYGMLCLELAARRSSIWGVVTVKGMSAKRALTEAKRQYPVCQSYQGSALVSSPHVELKCPFASFWTLHHPLPQLDASWKHLKKSNLRPQAGQELANACLQLLPPLVLGQEIYQGWEIYLLKKISTPSRQKGGWFSPLSGLPPSSS